MSGHRGTPTWLHHTLLEALSPARAMAEKVTYGSLRPRKNAVPSDRPLQQSGCTCRVRQGEPGSGEGQHTGTVDDSRRRDQSPSGCPSNGPRRWEKRPRRTWAFTDAVIQDLEPACLRRSPGVSSEASGSPALLPAPGRNCSVSKAVGRFSLEETARASRWARLGRVGPWPGVCSQRARGFCPAG
jgi:hypothetical protein